MKKVLLVGLILVLLFLTACGNQSPSSVTKPVELNISAASSLRDVLTEVQVDYTAQHPEVKLVFNFAGSGMLQQQIEQGAPADVFISAGKQQMDALQRQQLIEKSTRSNLCSNDLVLIVPTVASAPLNSFDDLTGANVKNIAIGEPKTVPAGQYALQLLNNLALLPAVQGKLVYAKDVRTVLAYVETGNVDAGIVYKTDALNNNKVRVVTLAEATRHDSIVYPMAIIAATSKAKQAADFLNYLSSPQARAVLAKYGFGQ